MLWPIVLDELQVQRIQDPPARLSNAHQHVVQVGWRYANPFGKCIKADLVAFGLKQFSDRICVHDTVYRLNIHI